MFNMRICVGTFNVRNSVYGFSSGGYVLCRNENFQCHNVALRGIFFMQTL